MYIIKTIYARIYTLIYTHHKNETKVKYIFLHTIFIENIFVV